MTEESRPSRRGTLHRSRLRPAVAILALLAAAHLGCSHYITHIYIEESPGKEGLPLRAEQVAIGIINEVAREHEFIFVSVSQAAPDMLAYYTKGSMDLRLFKDEVAQSLVFVLKDFETWNPTPVVQQITRQITLLAAERLPETTVVMSSQRDTFPYGP
jgi:hypothetical protein